MTFKLKYSINDIPSELVMAAYNSAATNLFSYQNFDEKLAVKNFLEVVDRDGDIKIKGKIDRLEARYKREFKKIMDEYNRDFRIPEYSENLNKCHNWAGMQFEWLTNQYNSHIKLYKLLEESLDEYLETGIMCFKKDEYTSVVAVKGGVVATYTNNRDRDTVFTKIYDKDLHEERLKQILSISSYSEEENVEE